MMDTEEELEDCAIEDFCHDDIQLIINCMALPEKLIEDIGLDFEGLEEKT
jgi:hypothetical protein